MARFNLPLIISVKTLNWRMNDKDAHEADAEFQKVRKKALEADQNTCVFCGFKSMRYQEVHHRNDDHADNRLENLVTACPYCHMCQHIGLAGRNKEAVLIYRPEIPQATLHHLVRTHQVVEFFYDRMRQDEAQKKTTSFKNISEIFETSRALMVSLKNSQEGAKQLIHTSDPSDLGDALMQIPEEEYLKRHESLAGIRLLPLGVRMQNGENVMKQMVESWVSPGGPYQALQPQNWKQLIKQFL